jgi:multiple sugar transport system permease protein
MEKSKISAQLNKLLKGNQERAGIPAAFLRYIVLIGIGFVYLYPMIYMLVNSFFSLSDLTDPRLTWIPSKLYFGNFSKAFETLDFFKSFGISVFMSTVPALLQTAVCSLVGFGLARFRIYFKPLWLMLIILTFVLPTQVMIVPRYVMFYNMHMINSVWVQYLPALLGQGIKSAIFILVYYQYFSTYPKSFDEAAALDGAGKFQIFLRIALPIAATAILLCALFSFVWYWNETYQANLLFGGELPTLPLKLQSFSQQYLSIYGSGGTAASDPNESIVLAGTLLSILPMLILYLCAQKYFIRSIEESGITGE